VRAEFDKILLDHACDSGADVREGTCVTDMELAPDGATLRCSGNTEVCARYVIDCSGRHSVIGNKLRLKREYPDLRKLAVFAHYENVRHPEGVDGTLTRMVRARDHWFWMIPLSGTKASVGVVMDTATFRNEKVSPEEMLNLAIESVPVMRERMAGSVRCTKVHTSGDYSFRNSALCGDCWLLAGDAAGFIDPIFSSGVFLAILSGETAADAVNIALDSSVKGRAAFSRYERRLNKVMDLYLRFVRSWYKQEFVEMLLNPQSFFEVVPAVNAVLAGNLGSSFALRWRLWIFHTLVRLQRFAPVSPRLALSP
jgi:flavin-dependent dehydrogenase